MRVLGHTLYFRCKRFFFNFGLFFSLPLLHSIYNWIFSEKFLSVIVICVDSAVRSSVAHQLWFEFIVLLNDKGSFKLKLPWVNQILDGIFDTIFQKKKKHST